MYIVSLKKSGSHLQPNILVRLFYQTYATVRILLKSICFGSLVSFLLPKNIHICGLAMLNCCVWNKLIRASIYTQPKIIHLKIPKAQHTYMYLKCCTPNHTQQTMGLTVLWNVLWTWMMWKPYKAVSCLFPVQTAGGAKGQCIYTMHARAHTHAHTHTQTHHVTP